MQSILATNIAATLKRVMDEQSEEVTFATFLFDRVEEFLRLVHATDAASTVLMTIALAILQDYEEVLVMWVHGFGDGATKLIRPLYEKVLTFAYLADHLGEISDFTDYSKVHWHKILQEGARVSEEGDEWIDPVDRENILKEYAAVRDRFRMTDCKKCKTERPMPSWTKRSTPELAKATHPVMRGLYFNAFLAPTMAIHPTFASMATQFQITDGKLELNLDVVREDNGVAYGIALSMAFVALVTMNRCFGLGQDETVAKVTSKFQAFQEKHRKMLGIAPPQ
jgi:hypothetical protein